MRGSGRTICRTDKESKHGLIMRVMKAAISTERKMGRVLSSLLIRADIQESFWIMRSLDMESITGKMVKSTKDSGRTIK